MIGADYQIVPKSPWLQPWGAVNLDIKCVDWEFLGNKKNLYLLRFCCALCGTIVLMKLLIVSKRGKSYERTRKYNALL